ncbi:DNA repair protein RadC [Neiella marina]|uniref:DNA repair protein RadC n=1 Tax=Neiella holothuriorum TaxID=2870530 RepID=A0ABS7EH23_9GAMM|nr:DNA repair protein RadC [Neiella holothuriorum]MBW8191213.1 DNA repair protein RadC [Neiella holothuriorum]
MQLNQWPQAMRPREKLMANGAGSLSDAELLAIFLRTGLPGCNVVDLAQQLLADFGTLSELISAPKQEFCQAKGLGSAKYVQLQAVMEMARRVLAAQLRRDTVMDSTESAKRYAAAELAQHANEMFALLLLDSQHRLIEFKTLFQGTINQASVYPRVIVQTVLAANAAAVILCHNHPSGIAEPSNADIQITQRIQDALALVDVTVLDHLVVTQGHVVSMAERQLI